MSKFLDLTGKRFGKLIVIKREERPEYLNNKDNKRIYWLCKCDCGKEKIILSSSLTTRNTSSCGCYQNSRKFKPYGEATKNLKYNNYKRNAKQRNIIFNLSKENFFKLITQDCFYCGSKPSNIEKSKYNNGDFICNGIDRIDNSKGYENGNVVPCCPICNYAKRKMTIEDFYTWINKVYENQHKKERR